MVLLGALINGLEAAVGGVLGLLFKGRVSERLGDFLLKGQGLAVVLVAVQGMMQGGSVAIVTLSVGAWLRDRSGHRHRRAHSVGG